jgi:crotonobetainyl-CoA:carnitine CoA-transferase CaiB-like acyl-CoA transferase
VKLLDGVRILDLSRLLPGPYCTHLLADLGAEVIKVEEPGRGDYIRSLAPFENGVSIAFELLNRGKKSIALNLETKQGQEILQKLAAEADVLLESYRPGTAKKLGCDFESIRRVNGRIVYCSLTAFGQTGPYKDLPGHDINCLALSGFLSLNGKDEPVVPALQVGDLAGGMLAALTIMTALFARQKRNEAQHIDVSMLDALLSWLILPLALHMEENASMLAGELPFYRLYRTLDSRFLAVGAIEPQFWEQLCKLINRPDLILDQYSSGPRRNEVVEAVQSVLATKTSQNWFRMMREHELPCTPILTLDEVLKDPHVRERHMLLAKDESGRRLTYVGSPCKIAGLDEVNLISSPELGQHSAELVKEIGYSQSEIQHLLEAGILQQSPSKRS